MICHNISWYIARAPAINFMNAGILSQISRSVNHQDRSLCVLFFSVPVTLTVRMASVVSKNSFTPGAKQEKQRVATVILHL